MRINTGCIYLILDKKLAGERTYESIIRETSKRGVKIVQLREKSMNTRNLTELAVSLKQVCRKCNVQFIVNDRVDIAMVSDADGVHLGHDDMDVKLARNILGPDKIIGISAGNDFELKYALNNPVDYISPGPVFGTKTKDDAGDTISDDFLKKVLTESETPVIPIGGIDKLNISKLKGLGFDTVAVISAILKSRYPGKATSELMEKLIVRGSND